MKRIPRHQVLSAAVLLLDCLALSGTARAQDAGAAQARKPADSPTEAIHVKYRQDLEKLERGRLQQIGEVAAGQPKPEAEATYREYFQLAITKGLYAEAGPTAGRLLAAGDLPSDLQTLASVVKIVAEADRGAYDDSLKSLAEAVGETSRRARPPGEPGRDLGLTLPDRVSVLEAYYQRLIRGGQYEVALKAMDVVAANVQTPAVRDLAARRTKQLRMIGRAAPAIAGVDLDGRPFRLDDAKGEVVLVVFWASWCLPSAQEIPRLEEAYRAYRGRGFRIVGIDVDAAPGGDTDPKSVIPAVRNFLVEFNVPWPTLISGRGDQDLTRDYAIAEIPANVLIGRDGTVIQLDLAGARLDAAIGEAVARKP